MGQAIDTKHTAELVSTVIELAGIAAMVIGIGLAFILSARTLLYSKDVSLVYQNLRRNLGKAILLGLELLVAADIVRSVAVDPSLVSVGVLGVIVVIRTFLSWSLELEINGRWPWQSSPPLSDTSKSLREK